MTEPHRYEYSLGPTGTFHRTSRSFADAIAKARASGVCAHLYVIRDGRRQFVGYAHSDGRLSLGDAA